MLTGKTKQKSKTVQEILKLRARKWSGWKAMVVACLGATLFKWNVNNSKNNSFKVIVRQDEFL